MTRSNTCLIVGNGAVSQALQRDLKAKVFKRADSIDEHRYEGAIDLIVAAPSAKKHFADANPVVDADECSKLLNTINTILKFNEIDSFMVLSTIDVYGDLSSEGLTEKDFVPINRLSVYGANRAWLERMFIELGASITRLPTVFGSTMNKGVIFDIIHKDCRFLPNHNSEMQFFDLINLKRILDFQLAQKIRILNIAPPRIKLSELPEFRDMSRESYPLEPHRVAYEMRSLFLSELRCVNERAFTKSSLLEDINKFIKERSSKI